MTVTQTEMEELMRSVDDALARLPIVLEMIDTLPTLLPETDRIEPSQVQKERREDADTRPQKHICSACGALFRSARDLYTHKYDNLWEDYLKEYQTGRCRCLFCSEMLPDTDAFHEHWAKNRDHADYALTFLNMGVVKTKREVQDWYMDPTEEAVLNKRMYADPEMRAVRKGKGAGNLIFKTVTARIKYNEMIVGVVYGIPGSGKSEENISFIYLYIIPASRAKLATQWLEKSEENYAAALIHREELRRSGDTVLDFYLNEISGKKIGIGSATMDLMRRLGKWRDPKVWITANVAETLKVVRLAKILDVIMQDEDPGLLGRGALTAKEKIETILQTMRKKRISFFFISPVRIQYVSNPNVVFEVTHKKLPLTERVSRGIYFDREGTSHGWWQHSILKRHELPMDVREFALAGRVRREILLEHMDEETADLVLAGAEVILPVIMIYSCIKDENLERWQEAGGGDSWQFNLRELKEDAVKAADILEREFKLDRLSDYSLTDIQRLMPACKVKDNIDYQNAVAKECKFEIEKRLTKRHVAGMDTPTEGAPEEDVSTRFSMSDDDYLGMIRAEWPSESHKWIDLFVKHKEGRSGYDTYQGIIVKLKQLDVRKKDGTYYTSPSGISNQFKTIKGRIRELKGALLEIEMLRLYSTSPNVEVMIPAPTTLRYPDDIAPTGVPDRVVVLIDGTYRVCAWKCYDSNATIPLFDSSKNDWCPEVLKARDLHSRGAKVKLVLEGIVKGEFFSVEVDPFDDAPSRTIKKKERSAWPPNVDKLLGGK